MKYNFVIFFLLMSLGITVATNNAKVCSKNVAIAIAMENAHGVTEKQFQDIKSEAKKAIKRLPNDGNWNVEIALDGFADISTMPTFESLSKDEIRNKINGLTYKALTCPKLSNAIQHASGILSKKDSTTTKIFLYIGSGRSHRDPHLIKNAESARAKGIRVIAVHTDDAKETQMTRLKKLVDDDELHVIPLEKMLVYLRIQNEIQAQCTACYKPTIDMVFLMDNSWSLINFVPKMKKMVKDFLNNYAIGGKEGEVQAALIPYAEVVATGKDIIPLQSRDKITLDKAIDDLKSIDYKDGSTTFTGKAINKALDVLKGARKTALKMIIIVSDTLSLYHDQMEAISHAKTARQSDVMVFLVSILSKTAMDKEFMKISGDPWNFIRLHHASPQTTDFTKLSNMMAQRTCSSAVARKAFMQKK